jgi:hypothetical protein
VLLGSSGKVNDRQLTDGEIKKIVGWVESGTWGIDLFLKSATKLYFYRL